jgi:hypothetical protein
MQNLGNVYICGFPFAMSRTDAQNGLDMVFKDISLSMIVCKTERVKDCTRVQAP